MQVPTISRKHSKEVRKYWISCPRFTVQVNTVNGRIVWTAPIVRKFIGQPLGNLIRWAGRSTQVTELGTLDSKPTTNNQQPRR